MLRSIFIFCILVVTTSWGRATLGADIAGYTPNSKEPWQLLMRLGPGPKAPEMLVVVDSSPGSNFYDKAVADTNLDGKLSDEKPPKSANRFGLDIPMVAPYGDVDAKAQYNLHINTQRGQRQRPDANPFTLFAVSLQLRSGDLNYSYLVIGQGVLDPTQPRVMRFGIGSPMKLEIKSKVEGTTLSLGTTIKDTQGQILRLATLNGPSGGMIVPHLKVTSPSGKVLVDKGLNYG